MQEIWSCCLLTHSSSSSPDCWGISMSQSNRSIWFSSMYCLASAALRAVKQWSMPIVSQSNICETARMELISSSTMSRFMFLLSLCDVPTEAPP